MARRWSADEDNLLRESYQDHGLQWVVDHLANRSRAAVAKRAMKLGIRGRQWTDSEDYVITVCYEKFGAAYCRRYIPRRTEIAIMSRARRLGVLRDRKKHNRDMIESHDEIGCMQAAIKTGWLLKPVGLPKEFFDLKTSS
ncbi:MAG: SANT/Myb-like DNA-binding domain-containing protein [Candidatus Thiodiazotropha endolucinida]|nr:SANT/Myb-like DNA-binding domain-containing protein [Candidatus Thiodiazotropha endolucinida]